MGINSILKRSTSLMTVICFVVSILLGDVFVDVVSAQSVPVVAVDASRGTYGYIPGNDLINVESMTIPKYMGKVDDVFHANSDKVIIHIQDAHCDYAAQQSIAEILGYLKREYGVSRINLEGGKGNYDLTSFTRIKDKRLREKVSDYFLKQGILNGAEYFAVNNPDKVDLWGVEDPAIYAKNLQVYRASLRYKDRVDRALTGLGRIINQLKSRMFNEDLIELDTRYAGYKYGDTEFRDYMMYLAGKARRTGIDLKKYPDIFFLVQSIEGEKDIDFKRATIERNVLIDRLNKVLSYREIEELVVKTFEFKKGTLSQNSFYRYLLGKASSAKIDISDYPELRDYIAYISIYHAIDRSRLMDDIEVLEQELKDSFYTDDDQKELDILFRNLVLMRNMFNIRFTKQDYIYYQKNRGSFSIKRYVDFIKEKGREYGIGTDLDEDISDIDEYRDEIFDFYRISFERDAVFSENLRLSAGKEGVGVLVTGGFHTSNICDIFRSLNISYISIIPKFKDPEGYKCPYFKLLSGGLDDAVRSLSGEGSSLALWTYLCETSPEGLPEVDMGHVMDVWTALVEARIRIDEKESGVTEDAEFYIGGTTYTFTAGKKGFELVPGVTVEGRRVYAKKQDGQPEEAARTNGQADVAVRDERPEEGDPGNPGITDEDLFDTDSLRWRERKLEIERVASWIKEEELMESGKSLIVSETPDAIDEAMHGVVSGINEAKEEDTEYLRLTVSTQDEFEKMVTLVTIDEENQERFEKDGLLPGMLDAGKKSVLLIDYSGSSSIYWEQFNLLFDEDASIRGHKVRSDLRIIGVISSEDYLESNSSFRSRFVKTAFMDSTAEDSMGFIHTGTPPDDAVYIDTYKEDDIIQRLMGGVEIDDEGMFRNVAGPLAQAIINNRPVVIRGLSWDDPRFLHFIRQLCLRKTVDINGTYHPLKKGFSIYRQRKDYKEGTSGKAIVNIDRSVRSGERLWVINEHNAGMLFRKSWVIEGSSRYAMGKGLLEREDIPRLRLRIQGPLQPWIWHRIMHSDKEMIIEVDKIAEASIPSDDYSVHKQQNISKTVIKRPSDLTWDKVKDKKCVLVEGDDLGFVRSSIESDIGTDYLLFPVTSSTSLSLLLANRESVKSKNRKKCPLVKIEKNDFMKALEDGKTVVLEGAQANSSLLKDLATLFCETPYLIYNGRRVDLADLPGRLIVTSKSRKSVFVEAENRAYIPFNEKTVSDLLSDKFSKKTLEKVMAVNRAFSTIRRTNTEDTVLPEKINMSFNRLSMLAGYGEKELVKAFEEGIIPAYSADPEVSAYMRVVVRIMFDDPEDRKNTVYRDELESVLNGIRGYDSRDPEGGWDSHFWQIADTLSQDLLRSSTGDIQSVISDLSVTPSRFGYMSFNDRNRDFKEHVYDNIKRVLVNSSDEMKPYYTDRFGTEYRGVTSPEYVAREVIARGEDGVLEAKDEFAKKEDLTMKALKRFGAVFLRGPPGTGKSHLAERIVPSRLGFPEEYITHITVGGEVKENKIIERAIDGSLRNTEEGMPVKWLPVEKRSTMEDAADDRGRLLIVDEANLTSSDTWNFLEGFFSKDANKRYIWIKGKKRWFNDKDRIIFTGNQESLAGRAYQDLFDEHVPTVDFHPFSDGYLRRIIREDIIENSISRRRLIVPDDPDERKVFMTRLMGLSDLLIRLHRVFEGIDPDKVFSIRDLQEFFERVIRKYPDADFEEHEVIFTAWQLYSGNFDLEEQLAIKRILIELFLDDDEREGKREEKSRFEMFFDDRIAASRRVMAGKYGASYADRGIVPVESVLDMSGTVDDFLYMRDRRLAEEKKGISPMPGKRGVIFEGPSGRGKDRVLLALLQSEAQGFIDGDEFDKKTQKEKKELEGRFPPSKRFYHINASPRTKEIKNKVERAKREGSIVIISEMNLLPTDFLEGVLNDVLTGKDAKEGFSLFATMNSMKFNDREKLSSALSNRIIYQRINDYSQEEFKSIARSPVNSEGLNEEDAVWAANIHCWIRKNIPMANLTPTTRDLLNTLKLLREEKDISVPEAVRRIYGPFYLNQIFGTPLGICPDTDSGEWKQLSRKEMSRFSETTALERVEKKRKVMEIVATFVAKRKCKVVFWEAEDEKDAPEHMKMKMAQGDFNESMGEIRLNMTAIRNGSSNDTDFDAEIFNTVNHEASHGLVTRSLAGAVRSPRRSEDIWQLYMYLEDRRMGRALDGLLDIKIDAEDYDGSEDKFSAAVRQDTFNWKNHLKAAQEGSPVAVYVYLMVLYARGELARERGDDEEAGRGLTMNQIRDMGQAMGERSILGFIVGQLIQNDGAPLKAAKEFIGSIPRDDSEEEVRFSQWQALNIFLKSPELLNSFNRVKKNPKVVKREERFERRRESTLAAERAAEKSRSPEQRRSGSDLKIAPDYDPGKEGEKTGDHKDMTDVLIKTRGIMDTLRSILFNKSFFENIRKYRERVVLFSKAVWNFPYLSDIVFGLFILIPVLAGLVGFAVKVVKAGIILVSMIIKGHLDISFLIPSWGTAGLMISAFVAAVLIVKIFKYKFAGLFFRIPFMDRLDAALGRIPFVRLLARLAGLEVDLPSIHSSRKDAGGVDTDTSIENMPGSEYSLKPETKTWSFTPRIIHIESDESYERIEPLETITRNRYAVLQEVLAPSLFMDSASVGNDYSLSGPDAEPGMLARTGDFNASTYEEGRVTDLAPRELILSGHVGLDEWNPLKEELFMYLFQRGFKVTAFVSDTGGDNLISGIKTLGQLKALLAKSGKVPRSEVQRYLDDNKRRSDYAYYRLDELQGFVEDMYLLEALRSEAEGEDILIETGLKDHRDMNGILGGLGLDLKRQKDVLEEFLSKNGLDTDMDEDRLKGNSDGYYLNLSGVDDLKHTDMLVGMTSVVGVTLERSGIKDLSFLKEMPEVHQMFIADYRGPPEQLRHLNVLKNIRKLILFNTPDISAVDFSNFRKMRNLTIDETVMSGFEVRGADLVDILMKLPVMIEVMIYTDKKIDKNSMIRLFQSHPNWEKMKIKIFDAKGSGRREVISYSSIKPQLFGSYSPGSRVSQYGFQVERIFSWLKKEMPDGGELVYVKNKDDGMSDAEFVSDDGSDPVVVMRCFGHDSSGRNMPEGISVDLSHPSLDIYDISMLNGMKWITQLDLRGCSVKDISIIESLPDLKMLDLEGLRDLVFKGRKIDKRWIFDYVYECGIKGKSLSIKGPDGYIYRFDRQDNTIFITDKHGIVVDIKEVLGSGGVRQVSTVDMAVPAVTGDRYSHSDYEEQKAKAWNIIGAIHGITIEPNQDFDGDIIKVNIDRSEMDDIVWQAIERLSAIPLIHSLTVVNRGAFSDLDFIARFKQLRRFEFICFGESVGEYDLGPLSGLDHLNSIRLTGVKNADIDPLLSSLSGLEEVAQIGQGWIKPVNMLEDDVKGFKVLKMDQWGGTIYPGFIAGMPDLEVLELPFSDDIHDGIIDDIIPVLLKLPRLRKVRMYGLDNTDPRLGRLLREHPNRAMLEVDISETDKGLGCSDSDLTPEERSFRKDRDALIKVLTRTLGAFDNPEKVAGYIDWKRRGNSFSISLNISPSNCPREVLDRFTSFVHFGDHPKIGYTRELVFLEKISVSGAPINDLEGIGFCKSVQTLAIETLPDTDLTPLKDLAGLRTLYLSNYDKGQLSVFHEMPGLRRVNYLTEGKPEDAMISEVQAMVNSHPNKDLQVQVGSDTLIARTEGPGDTDIYPRPIAKDEVLVCAEEVLKLRDYLEANNVPYLHCEQNKDGDGIELSFHSNDLSKLIEPLPVTTFPMEVFFFQCTNISGVDFLSGSNVKGIVFDGCLPRDAESVSRLGSLEEVTFKNVDLSSDTFPLDGIASLGRLRSLSFKNSTYDASEIDGEQIKGRTFISRILRRNTNGLEIFDGVGGTWTWERVSTESGLDLTKLDFHPDGSLAGPGFDADDVMEEESWDDLLDREEKVLSDHLRNIGVDPGLCLKRYAPGKGDSEKLSLVLTGNNIKGFAGFPEGLRSLQYISIMNTPVLHSIARINDVAPGLNGLSIISSPVSSLDALRECGSLKYMYIHDVPIDSVEPLMYIPNLRSLRITGAEPLIAPSKLHKQLNSVQSKLKEGFLCFSRQADPVVPFWIVSEPPYNGIDDIKNISLRDWNNKLSDEERMLKEYLQENGFSDPEQSIIRYRPSNSDRDVLSLHLSGAGIKTLGNIVMNLRTLRYITIRDMPDLEDIRDIVHVAPDLAGIHISGTRVSDISVLAKLKYLRYISLFDAPVEGLGELAIISSLQSLHVGSASGLKLEHENMLQSIVEKHPNLGIRYGYIDQDAAFWEPEYVPEDETLRSGEDASIPVFPADASSNKNTVSLVEVLIRALVSPKWTLGSVLERLQTEYGEKGEELFRDKLRGLGARDDVIDGYFESDMSDEERDITSTTVIRDTTYPARKRKDQMPALGSVRELYPDIDKTVRALPEGAEVLIADNTKEIDIEGAIKEVRPDLRLKVYDAVDRVFSEPSETFDTVILGRDFCRTFEDRPMVIREVHRILKQGGVGMVEMEGVSIIGGSRRSYKDLWERPGKTSGGVMSVIDYFEGQDFMKAGVSTALGVKNRGVRVPSVIITKNEVPLPDLSLFVVEGRMGVLVSGRKVMSGVEKAARMMASGTKKSPRISNDEKNLIYGNFDQGRGLIGKLYDTSGKELLTEGIEVEDDGGDSIIVKHPVKRPKGVAVKKSSVVSEKTTEYLLEVLLDLFNKKGRSSLTGQETGKIKELIGMISKAEKVIGIQDYRQGKESIDGILAPVDAGYNLYLNENILSDPLAVIHELGEGFVSVPDKVMTRHTYMRGAGKDVRIAYGQLVDVEGIDAVEALLQDENPDRLIETLEGAMEKLGMLGMTESEKALINYNFAHKDERALNNIKKSKMLLFGLQDHLDPDRNLDFTLKLRGLRQDLRRGKLNIHIIRSSNFETDAKTRGIARDYKKDSIRFGLNEVVILYDEESKESLNRAMEEAVRQAGKASRETDIDPEPMISVHFHDKATGNMVDEIMGSADKTGAYKDSIVKIFDKLPDGPDSAGDVMVEVSKIIAIGDILCNDVRLKRLKDEGKLEDARLSQIRKNNLLFLRSCGFIDPDDFDPALITAQGLDLDVEMENLIENIISGKYGLRITRIDYNEISQWEDAQREVLRSL